MAALQGAFAKLYYTAGDQDDATTEITNVRDVTVTIESGESDVSTRANAGWRAIMGTLKAMTFEWEMVWDTEDAGFTAIRTAALALAHADRIITLKALDQAGGQGPVGCFEIMSFARPEPLEEAITVSVTAKVTYAENTPRWVV